MSNFLKVKKVCLESIRATKAAMIKNHPDTKVKFKSSWAASTSATSNTASSSYRCHKDLLHALEGRNQQQTTNHKALRTSQRLCWRAEISFTDCKGQHCDAFMPTPGHGIKKKQKAPSGAISTPQWHFLWNSNTRDMRAESWAHK